MWHFSSHSYSFSCQFIFPNHQWFMWKSVNQYAQQPMKKMLLILVRIVLLDYYEKLQISMLFLHKKGNKGQHKCGLLFMLIQLEVGSIHTGFVTVFPIYSPQHNFINSYRVSFLVCVLHSDPSDFQCQMHWCSLFEMCCLQDVHL